MELQRYINEASVPQINSTTHEGVLMPSPKKPHGQGKSGPFTIDLTTGKTSQPNTYRERALALFPHVCARCGREFSGKQLKELTVHHLDSDHMNNPPDGSNWELLCLYCHDDEHGAYEKTTGAQQINTVYSDKESSGFNPFANLGALLKPKDDDTKKE